MRDDIEETIESNFQDFMGSTVTEDEVIMEVENTEKIVETGEECIFMNLGRPLAMLPERYAITELPRESLLNLAYRLSHSVLYRNPTEILPDHLLYWSWTAAFGSQMTTEAMAAERTEDESEPSEFVQLHGHPGRLFSDYNIFEDFCRLVHVLLLEVRQNSLDRETNDQIRRLNPSIGAFGVLDGLKFSATTGFSVLQGFLRRQTNQLTIDGKATEEFTLEVPHKDEPVKEGKNGSVDALTEYYLWMDEHDRDDTALQSLMQIDELTRERIEILEEKIGGLNHELDNGFLFSLLGQRHGNIHAEMRTQLIGVVVMNLCCLLIWNAIDEDSFEDARNIVKRKTRNARFLRSHESKMAPPPRANRPDTLFPI